jgi:26S proteasome regulatory subunit N9
MKALSLELIHGKIDQVAQIVQVDWVQPRVLDKKQIDEMRVRLSVWKEKVGQVVDLMQNETPELFVQ